MVRNIPDDVKEWISEYYFVFAYTEIQGGISYLNQAITWAVGASTAFLAFIATQEAFLKKDYALINFCASLFSIVLITHFLGRGIRAYLNVMRYSTIVKKLTAARLSWEGNDCTWDDKLLSQLIDDIHAFHVNWKSPLLIQDVLRKFFVEFGFGILYYVMILLSIYWFMQIDISIDVLIIIVIFFVALAFDLYFGLFQSSYFKSQENFAVHQ